MANVNTLSQASLHNRYLQWLSIKSLPSDITQWIALWEPLMKNNYRRPCNYGRLCMIYKICMIYGVQECTQALGLFTLVKLFCGSHHIPMEHIYHNILCSKTPFGWIKVWQLLYLYCVYLTHFVHSQKSVVQSYVRM